MIIVYGISSCDTVKKARAWLGEQGLEHAFHDFKKLGVPADRLEIWLDELGQDKLLNRQGTTWRKLNAAVQASASEATGATAVMLANPSVIKRPVVEWQILDGMVTVGFNTVRWAVLADQLNQGL